MTPTLSANALEEKRSRFWPQLSKYRIICLKAAVISVFAAGSLYLVSHYCPSRPTVISGQIVTADTNVPLSNVFVAVESVTHDERGFGDYVKTDGNGKFQAEIRGRQVSIKAWKPGYAMNGVIIGTDVAAPPVIIDLRKLASTNLVEEQSGFYDLMPSHGFSFRLGTVLDRNSSETDVVFVQSPNDKSMIFVEAQGKGGIIAQTISESLDYYNTPEAPQAGYEKRVKIDTRQAGLYFVRTGEGEHYAKFMLIINTVILPNGSKTLDVKGSRLIWSYQPDGTRNLEVKPSRLMPFPFHKFNASYEG